MAKWTLASLQQNKQPSSGRCGDGVLLVKTVYSKVSFGNTGFWLPEEGDAELSYSVK